MNFLHFVLLGMVSLTGSGIRERSGTCSNSGGWRITISTTIKDGSGETPFFSSGAQSLSCYQCIKNSSEECGPKDLQPCPRVADRCVTHISRHADKGFLIKRECGLGPCGFEDDMVNKGLGMNGCDRSKDEYFCVFCCGTDGCNKNGSSERISIKGGLVTLTFIFLKKALF